MMSDDMIISIFVIHISLSLVTFLCTDVEIVPLTSHKPTYSSEYQC